MVGAEWEVEAEQRERETGGESREWLVAEWGGGVMDHVGPCKYWEDFGFC